MYNGVYSTLKRMEERNTFTIQDALNVFQDICEDIRRETGSPIEKQPVGDIESVVTGLCSTARTIAKIYRQNEKAFSREQFQTRWEKATKKLDEALEKMETLKTEIQKQQELKEKYSRIKKENETLQQEFESIKRNNIQLSAEKERLCEGITNMKKEVEHQRETNAKLQYQQQKAKAEMQRLEENYRKVLDEQQRREAFLRELWRKTASDDILKNDWMGKENGELNTLYEAVENQSTQAHNEIEKFRNGYSVLVKFLEEGGF